MKCPFLKECAKEKCKFYDKENLAYSECLFLPVKQKAIKLLPLARLIIEIAEM